LSKLAQHQVPFLESRTLLEAPEGPQARLKERADPYDLEILRQHGLGELAVSLEKEIQPEDEEAEQSEGGTEGEPGSGAGAEGPTATGS
jgi:hypothetical protein